MHAALDGGDAVGVAVDALVVAGVPLHRDVEHLAVVVVVLELADLGEQRLLGGVQVLDEVDDPALVLVRDLLLAGVALVGEHDLETLVQERHGLQALEHGAGDELDALGGEDRRIGPERDGRARLAAAPRRVADDEHLALGDAALGVLLAVALAVAVDLDDEALGQRVDDGHADAVETAGDLVAVAAELAAGVQHGEHDLGCALALVLASGERVDGDAAAVVVDLTAAVGEQRDPDARAVAGHRFVDRVVDDLPDQVVQAGEAGRTDVHAGPLADRIEAFEDLDRVGVVGRRRLRLIGVRSARTSCGWGTSASGISVVSLDTRTSMSCWRSIAWPPPGVIDERSRPGDAILVR